MLVCRSRTTLSKCRFCLLEPPLDETRQKGVPVQSGSSARVPMLTNREFSKLYGTGKTCCLKLWYNFKCEMSSRKMLYTGHVVETEMPTKTCHTGHSCYPLKNAFTQRSVFLPSITTHLARFCRFSALRRLCSDLPPGVLFVINFLCNRSTWATDWEAGRAGSAFGIVAFALLLHFSLSIFGCNWRQAVDQSGHTSILVILGGFSVILVFLTHHFTICSLCWEIDSGCILVSSLIWAWQHSWVGCGEGSEHFRYWSLAASLCSNPPGEASFS